MHSADDDLNDGGSIHDLQHAPDLHHSPYRSRLHTLDVVNALRQPRSLQNVNVHMGHRPSLSSPLPPLPSSPGTTTRASPYSRRRIWSADNAAAAAGGIGAMPQDPSLLMTGQSSITGYYSHAFSSSFRSQHRQHQHHESVSSFASGDDRWQQHQQRQTSNRSILSGLSGAGGGAGGGIVGGASVSHSHSANNEYYEHASSAMQIPEVSSREDDGHYDYSYDAYGYRQEHDPYDKEGDPHKNKQFSTSDHRHHHYSHEEEEDELSQHGSDKESLSDGHDDEDAVVDDDGNASHTSVADLPHRTRKLCGINLPQMPTLNQIAVAVVTYAPCFCCYGFKMRTDRIVLGRLNVLLAFCSLYQMAAGIFLAIVMTSKTLVDRGLPPQKLSPDDDSYSSAAAEVSTALWNVNGNIFLMAIFASVIFISAVLTFRVVRYVNLVGAIRYMWVLSWSITFETYALVCLFDYHSVSTVWIKHWWRDSTMAWFRAKSCVNGTANTLCSVPVLANVTFEDAWCRLNYNSTSCVAIRNGAQDKTHTFLQIFYLFSACWGIFVVMLIYLTTDTLEHIITKPLVQKSKQSNIPLWLSLPLVGCVMIGLLLKVWGQKAVNYVGYDTSWIAYAYLVSGGLFMVAIISGWFASTSSIQRTSDKRSKLLAVYTFIGAMISADFLLIAVFGTAISFSASLVNNPISDSVRGDIACSLNGTGGCTRCNATENRCPEWSTEDITALFRSQAVAIATLSAIFFLYAIGAVRFGLTVRKHLSTYQIEYV